jgi:hypothetical protein
VGSFSPLPPTTSVDIIFYTHILFPSVDLESCKAFH